MIVSGKSGPAKLVESEMSVHLEPEDPVSVKPLPPGGAVFAFSAADRLSKSSLLPVATAPSLLRSGRNSVCCNRPLPLVSAGVVCGALVALTSPVVGVKPNPSRSPMRMKLKGTATAEGTSSNAATPAPKLCLKVRKSMFPSECYRSVRSRFLQRTVRADQSVSNCCAEQQYSLRFHILARPAPGLINRLAAFV